MHGFWKRPIRLVFKCAFMKNIIALTLAALLLPGLLLAQSKRIDSSVVPDFNLSKYLGTWYEIARFDHSFERGLSNVTAEYSLRPDGKVKVLNTGWKDGKKKVAEGKARQPDPIREPSHLEVSFFLFFYSDYDILLLDEDYRYALVGSRSPEYLWLLAREPHIEPSVRDEILAEAQKLGYDISKLIWVNQSVNMR